MSHKKSAKQQKRQQDTFSVTCFEDEDGLVNLDLGAMLLRFTKEEFVSLADAMYEAKQYLTDEIPGEEATTYSPNILLM